MRVPCLLPCNLGLLAFQAGGLKGESYFLEIANGAQATGLGIQATWALFLLSFVLGNRLDGLPECSLWGPSSPLL